MSYILEALKKAQAERQLGETPTIHAATLDAPTGQGGNGPLRKPLLAALVAMGVVIVGLGVVVWRQAAPVQGPPVPVAEVAQVAPAPSAAPPVVAALPAPPAPVVRAAEPVPAVAPPVRPVPVVTASKDVQPPAAPPVPVSVPATPPQAVARSEPAEEPVQALRDLPEPIRRAIPAIAMSGYMYSSNPSDRLILIDKVLRREGEEVAPGVMLVRLEPKGAVFTFRGYRYRVPY